MLALNKFNVLLHILVSDSSKVVSAGIYLFKGNN